MKKYLELFSTFVFIIIANSCKKSDIPANNNSTILSEVASGEILSIEPASVPTTGLVAWYRLNLGSGDDNTSNNNNGTAYNTTSAPNRNGSAGLATRFNGANSYIQVPDKSYLSISATGKLSISVWMKPEVLDFPSSSGGYVHWLGKGFSNQHEYVLRIYNKNSDRPNRVSCYAFNIGGGLGAGSYFQDVFTVNQWVHVTAVYDYPNNSIKIYKNAVLRDSDTFSSYDIIPQNGSAPLRIGTRDFASYFKGCLDDLRIYNRVLTQSEINALYAN